MIDYQSWSLIFKYSSKFSRGSQELREKEDEVASEEPKELSLAVRASSGIQFWSLFEWNGGRLKGVRSKVLMGRGKGSEFSSYSLAIGFPKGQVLAIFSQIILASSHNVKLLVFIPFIISKLPLSIGDQPYHIIWQQGCFQIAVDNLKMQLEGIENIIEILNAKGVPKHPKKVDKQQGHDEAAGEILPEQLVHLEQFPDFNKLYTTRMQKMDKKNEAKQQYLNKKKEIKDKLEKQNQNNELLNVGKGELTQKIGIRYLIFKNWSGNHLDIELCDRGYKYRFTNGVASLIKHLLQENGFVEGFGQEGLIIWNIGVIGSAIYQAMGAYQKINHFPKSFQITRKDLMLQNLSKMKHRFARQYNFFPQTFILPNQTSIFIDNAQKQKQERWYIIKPHNSSQGKGIWLSNSAEQILQKQKDCIVVSEYIHNPLLANGLKFDMRVYVAITCWNPLRIYVYEDGLTRFATSPYTFDLSSKENLFAHLTNYSLNKFADNFEPNDDQDECKGHKWSHYALRQYLKQEGHDVATAWARIDEVIIKSILSIENTVFSALQMTVPYRTNCFEVLGFDILLDNALRPWLLEINLSPSLNTDSPLDLKIKGSMIADLFTMIGVVPPDQQFGVDKSYLLNQNKMSAKEMKNEYNKLERLVIKQSQQEEKRSGGWRKIFPTENAVRYKQLFDVDRPLNRLMRDEELRKFKSKNMMNGNYNQAVRNLENPHSRKNI